MVIALYQNLLCINYNSIKECFKETWILWKLLRNVHYICFVFIFIFRNVAENASFLLNYMFNKLYHFSQFIKTVSTFVKLQPYIVI